MSSSHIIVVARNTETGEVELPLDDLILYGTGDEGRALELCRKDYTSEWVLSLYAPIGSQLLGSKN